MEVIQFQTKIGKKTNETVSIFRVCRVGQINITMKMDEVLLKIIR